MSRASQADWLPLTQVLFLVLGEKEGGCLTSADCILAELQTNLRINLDGTKNLPFFGKMTSKIKGKIHFGKNKPYILKKSLGWRALTEYKAHHSEIP